MKTMYKKLVLKCMMMLLATAFIFTLSSCSDRDDDDAGGNTYKLTLTLNGVDNDDHVSFSLAGTNTNADSNVWKVNGETQAGQMGISMDEDSFTGSTKTYVIESNFKLVGIASGLTVSNFGTSTITGNFKIEKNGSEVVNQPVNLTSSGANLTKHYNL